MRYFTLKMRGNLCFLYYSDDSLLTDDLKRYIRETVASCSDVKVTQISQTEAETIAEISEMTIHSVADWRNVALREAGIAPY